MAKNYVPSPWTAMPTATFQPAAIDLVRIRGLLDTVTNYELYDVVTSSYSYSDPDEHPVLSSGETKRQRVEYLVRWLARNPQSRVSQRIIEKLEAKVSEKGQYPVRGPVPGTKYLSWKEFTSLKSYPLIANAVEYCHDYRKKCSPQTKDGYVSVDAIYNMSAWASWKSSSLGASERVVANAIQELKLGELMRLNKGRRSDQPALFPGGFLLGGGRG